MDSMDALFAVKSASIMNTQPGAAGQSQNTAGISFDELLNAITADGNGGVAAAGEIEQELASGIAQRLSGAPDYLYSFHPKVYEKMSTDPEFTKKMVATVDEWTQSAMFTQAKNTDAFSSLLVGEDGEYTAANTLMSGLGGSTSILDFIVSDETLLQQSGMQDFLAQFEELPEDLAATLQSGLDQASLATDATTLQYQAMAAAAEVQKRMLE